MTPLTASLTPLLTLARSGDAGGAILFVVVIAIVIISSIVQSKQEKSKGNALLHRTRNPKLRYGDERSFPADQPGRGGWERVPDPPAPPPVVVPAPPPVPLERSRPQGRRSGGAQALLEDRRSILTRDPVAYNENPTHEAPAAPRAQRAQRADRATSVQPGDIDAPDDGQRRKRRRAEPNVDSVRSTTGSGREGREGTDDGLLPKRFSARDAARALVMGEIFGPPPSLRHPDDWLQH
ncbi:MAG: hypothetical protein AB7K09_13010 [Planctomycetota bacterium]